jgi:hypothetical protein
MRAIVLWTLLAAIYLNQRDGPRHQAQTTEDGDNLIENITLHPKPSESQHLYHDLHLP